MRESLELIFSYGWPCGAAVVCISRSIVRYEVPAARWPFAEATETANRLAPVPLADLLAGQARLQR